MFLTKNILMLRFTAFLTLTVAKVLFIDIPKGGFLIPEEYIIGPEKF